MRNQFQYYFLMDAAKIGDRISEFTAIESDAYCLYLGNSGVQLKEVAPYLFHLNEKNIKRFVSLYEQAFSFNSIGYFVISKYELKETLRHFRKFLKVADYQGREMYFRFYDPRVFSNILPLFDKEQLSTFLGPLEAILTEDISLKEYKSYRISNGQLLSKSIELDLIQSLKNE